MSTLTPNIKLVKPAGTDNVDINVINKNFDIIDENIIGNGVTVCHGTPTDPNIKAWVDLDAEPSIADTTYSTEEKRVGTWINGKPIYRKVIRQQVDWAGATAYEAKHIPHGIENFSECISVRVISAGYPIPYITASGGVETAVQSVTAESVKFINKISWNGYYMIITLEYTKTTD